MKRILVAIALLICFSSVALAVEPNWGATPNIPISGRFGATKAYTFSADAAVALTTMYVSGWVDTTYGQPIGAIVSVETYDARFSCGGGTPTTSGLGHLLAAGSSFMFSTWGGEGCKFINKTAGSNALVQITPIYSK